MKRTFCIVSIAAGLVLPAAAQSPIELIAQVDSTTLREYALPLAESYGVAMGTGLYHSAKSHKFLGFDLGVRLMLIQIPNSARTFDAHVRYCYFDSIQQDTVWVDTVIEGAATIFGQRGIQTDYIPEGAIGVPPWLPGGLGLSVMPLLVPQASVGLPVPGMELMARYVPWPFKGTTVHFLGLGLKQELTAISALKVLPVDLAIQGFFQKLAIGDAMNSNTWGGNVHVSKGFLMLTPYAGIGFDNTDMRFDYTFNFNEPVFDIGPPPSFRSEPRSIEVSYDYSSGMSWRTTIGASLKLGLILVNVDYSRNLTSGYNAINVGAGIGLR